MAQQNKPLTLAIIIPVYNDARYLKDCLEAIASQTESADEVIVVDNNSIDDLGSVVRNYKFVKLIAQNKQGVVYARNKGFNDASSDIVGRIDADTILPPDWVEQIKKFYKDTSHENYAWTGGAVFRNTRYPRLFGWFQSQIAYRFNRILLGHYILWGSNMAITSKQWGLVKREVCLNNHIHEDLDLAIHLDKHGVQISYWAYVKASVIMRRLDNTRDLHQNLMLWPETLKVHGFKTWVFGWLGAKLIYILSQTVSITRRDNF